MTSVDVWNQSLQTGRDSSPSSCCSAPGSLHQHTAAQNSSGGKWISEATYPKPFCRSWTNLIRNILICLHHIRFSTNLCSTWFSTSCSSVYCFSIPQTQGCYRMQFLLCFWRPVMNEGVNCEQTWANRLLSLHLCTSSALTLMMGVINSSKKLCLRREGQLWWMKLISKPLIWDPSWSCFVVLFWRKVQI